MKSGSCDERAGHLGFVTHELRNPLSTALWCAELLERLAPAERAGPRGEKLVAMTRRALTRLSRVLEDHFLAERLAAGGITPRGEKLQLRTVLEEAAGKAGLAQPPELDLGADSWVTADPALLERALEAMLSAAGREGAPVRVQARASGAGLRLVVSGAPVAPEALEPARKGSPSDPSGRALGLLLARVVVEAHGARLRAEGGGLVLEWESAPAAPETAGESHP